MEAWHDIVLRKESISGDFYQSGVAGPVRRFDRSRYDISSDRTFDPEEMDSNGL